MRKSRINGIQHIGIAVENMNESLPYYRKFFGLDIPFFDSVAAAPLMVNHTNGEVITKRASMILNLQGGCAVEVIRPTSFEPSSAKHRQELGDLGIFVSLVKCKNIQEMFEYCKKNQALGLSELHKQPDGSSAFMIQDLDGNWFQYQESGNWFTQNDHPSGGMAGCVIGVSNMEKSLELYSGILGYDEILYDNEGTFEDWKHLPGGNSKFRRVKLTQSQQPGGGFARVAGQTYIELIERKDFEPSSLFKDRIWADKGIVHLGFDVVGMKALGEELAAKGFSFTCDSNDALDMGQTKVHCTYIDDPDKTWLELIEVYKVPIIEKWGIFLNVEKRDPDKPLPNAMLKALRFSRIKD